MLCGFVIYTTGASGIVLSCSLVSSFFRHFSIVITSLGAARAGLCVSRAFVGLFCTSYFFFFLFFFFFSFVLFLFLLVSRIGCDL